MRENTISNVIIGACIEIHKDLGPGLLESVYVMKNYCSMNLRLKG